MKAFLFYNLNQWLDFMWKITESTRKLTTPLCPSSLPHGFLVVSLGRIFTQSGCFASVEVQAKISGGGESGFTVC